MVTDCYIAFLVLVTHILPVVKQFTSYLQKIARDNCIILLYDQNYNSTWINGTFFLLDSNVVYQNINRHKTKDRVIRTPLKTGGDLRCSGRVSSSCSTSGIRRVNLVTNR